MVSTIHLFRPTYNIVLLLLGFFTTTVVIKGIDKSLIQKPWYCKGHIMGLSISCFTLFFVSGIDRLEHASLLWTWNLWMLWGFSCRDLVAVQINYNEGESERCLVVCSAYLPCDSEDPPPTREFEELMCYCEEENLYLVTGCNSNANHMVWDSTNYNDRGVALLEFLNSSNVEILNQGNHSTYCRAEVERWVILPWVPLDSWKDLQVGRFLLNPPCQIMGIFCSC